MRPTKNQYFMGLAFAAAARADCKGRRVGAVIAVEGRVIATGYNGTPFGLDNCSEGGCYRCAHREEFPAGVGYDKCICVHAEENAILSSARHGSATNRGVLYSTLQPCTTCLKAIRQAGITSVFWFDNLEMDLVSRGNWLILIRDMHAERLVWTS